jgi:RNA polymerase sigma-70 factor (ECF subfamily)
MGNAQDEKKLVQQVLSGDRKAFERLVRQYEALVLHIVNPMIGNLADREDLCQEVFIKVYQCLNGFEFRSRLSTWIGTIAWNACVNFLQKKRDVPVGDLFAADETLSADSPPTPEDLLIKKQEAKHLTAAIEQLPAVQKTVLLLFHHDDLSLDEIAQILSIPVNTVKSHLFRARKNLKAILTNISAS